MSTATKVIKITFDLEREALSEAEQIQEQNNQLKKEIVNIRAAF
jgi:hypothetical protein